MPTETVKETDPTAESLCREMAVVRRDLCEDITDVAAQARQLTDWRSYMKKSPWIGLAVSAAVGFVAVPRKLKVNSVDPDEIAKLARQQRIVVESKPKAAAKAGLGSTLFRLLSGVVIRTAVGVATQKAAGFMSPDTTTSQAAGASNTGTSS